jgi:hypothetical protein
MNYIRKIDASVRLTSAVSVGSCMTSCNSVTVNAYVLCEGVSWLRLDRKVGPPDQVAAAVVSLLLS